MEASNTFANVPAEYNDSNKKSGKPKVILGPIIGDVTHNSARILIEFNISGKFKCVLKPSQGGISTTCTRDCMAKVPQVFSFNGVEPKTHYNVSFKNGDLPIETIKSSFRTFRENHDKPGALRVAVISCNEISHQEEKEREGKDLWGSIGQLVEDLDCVLHIGDQVYMDMGKNEKDCPYQRCFAILKKTDRSEWEYKKDDLLEILREQYRKTWAKHETIRHVLANVPNLMICDDHEFRDDWGWRAKDNKKDSIDYFYGQLARQVYYEYQRQLREDIPWDDLPSLRRESYHKIIHNVGISFMEYRGCRSWFRDVNLKETHMGANQLKWVESLYKPGGEFDSLTATLFVSPVPLYFLSHNMAKLARLNGDDIQEHFTYASVRQLEKLLDLLREWKWRDSRRRMFLVGGDVHMGGCTEIYYKDTLVFKQLVSSAINGKAINWLEKGIIDLLQHVGNKSGNYKFEHKDWVKENNYGEINVENDNGTISMSAGIYID